MLINFKSNNVSRPGECRFARKSGDTQIAHTSEYSLERRQSIRYRLNTSVMFRWSGPEDGSYQGEGVTRDISVAGTFVETATCPPPNSLIQMEVFFPLSDGGAKALMNADMMVLRVEHNAAGSKRSGFSAVGKGFSLRTFSERATRLVDGLIKQSEESIKGSGCQIDSRRHVGDRRVSSVARPAGICIHTDKIALCEQRRDLYRHPLRLLGGM